MSELVVIGFKNRFQAEGMQEAMLKLAESGAIVVEDVVSASRGQGAHVDIKQMNMHGGRKGAKVGAGVGLLAGLLLGGPIGGLLAGATIGVIGGRMRDYGIDDHVIKQVNEGLAPETSALFVLVSAVNDRDAVMRVFTGAEGVLLTTTLSPEARARLESDLAK